MTLNINRKILSQLLLASPPFPNDTIQKRPGKRSKWTQENHPPKIFDTTAADSKAVCNCHQTDIWPSWLAGAQICLPGLQTFCPQPVNDHLKRIWIEDKRFLQWELDRKVILYLIVLSPQGPLSPVLDQHQSIIKLGEVLGITLVAIICGKRYTNYVNVFLTNLTQEKCYNLDQFLLVVGLLLAGKQEIMTAPIFLFLLAISSDWCQFIIAETQTQVINLAEIWFVLNQGMFWKSIQHQNWNVSEIISIDKTNTLSNWKVAWKWIISQKQMVTFKFQFRSSLGPCLRSWSLSGGVQKATLCARAKFYPTPDHCTLRCDQNYARPI